MNNLRDAIDYVEANHPLPRCEHGQALRDHSGEALEPPCGCRAVNSEPTVEEALKQAQALIPDNKEWITCRSTVRWTGQGGNQHLGRFAEIEVGDESLISATLSEALEQVRKWKQEQSS